MVAAMMGSLSAVINSASTVITMDFYQPFIHPSASSSRLVLVGRFATILMILLSLTWVLVLGKSSHQQGGTFIVIQELNK